MNRVRKSWIFSPYCSGLRLMMPINSRKFKRRDLASRFKINARSECVPGPEPEVALDGVEGGVYSCSIPCSASDGKTSFSW